MNKIKSLGLLAAALIAVAGCTTPGTGGGGSSTDGGAPPAPPALVPGAEVDAANWISDVETAMSGLKTYSIDMSASTTTAGTTMDVTFVGKIDKSDPDPANTQFDGSMSVSGMSIDMIVTKTDAYMNMGGSWTKMSADARPDINGTTEPVNLVTAMKSGIKSVKYVGEETLSGTPTRHFEVTATDSSDGGILGNLTGSTVVINVWLDADNFQRKAEFTATRDADTATVSVTVNDINVPVTITAPI